MCAVCLVAQLCPTLCDPWTVAHQPPLSVGILQTRILEWVAMPSSRGSSQPRGGTQVSHIAGRFFTIWATREDNSLVSISLESVTENHFIPLECNVSLVVLVLCVLVLASAHFTKQSHLLLFMAVVSNLFGTRDWFCGRQFFHRLTGSRWWGECFEDDSSALYLLCTFFLLLHHLHLRSSGIRSCRLGTPALWDAFWRKAQ